MSRLHFTLQGKGGIGKSFVASLVAQHYLGRGSAVECIDADPVSRTLSGYPRFGARRLAFEASGSIDQDALSLLTEELSATQSDVIVDVGPCAFLPLWTHLVSRDALRTLVAAGQSPVIHVVLAGNALTSLLEALESLLALIPAETQVVLWRNDYFGPVAVNGRSFEETSEFERARHRIFATLHLPRYSSTAVSCDVSRMLERRLTFDEVARSEGFYLVNRQRLIGLKRKLFAQLELLP